MGVRNWWANWSVVFSCLLMLALAGCGEPTEDQADSSSTNAGKASAPVEDKETLFSTLVQLERRYEGMSFGQRVQDSKVRVKIVDSLFTLELTKEERSRALVSQIDALTKLHATREISSSERLKELAKKHANDPDPQVARAAKIATTAVRLVEFIRTDYGKYEPLKTSIKELLEQYPSDPEIARSLEHVTVQLFQRDKDREANDIMSMMILTYSKSPSAKMKEYVGMLQDRIKLVEVEFSALVQGINLGGAKERAAFETGLRRLAADHTIGITAYDEISRASRWLECNGLHSAAAEVYQAMDQLISKHPTTFISDKAKEESRLGLKRLRQIGKKIELGGKTLLGDEIDPADFEGKVVLLYFWSAEKPLTLKGMGELFPIYKNFPRDQFEIIAISIDEDEKKPMQVLGTRIPPWTVMIPKSQSDADEESLIDHCAVHYIPYSVLLDTSGKVDQVNVSVGTLDQNIRRLIREGREEAENANNIRTKTPVRRSDRRISKRVYPVSG